MGERRLEKLAAVFAMARSAVKFLIWIACTELVLVVCGACFSLALLWKHQPKW
jgi:hypothetical protein